MPVIDLTGLDEIIPAGNYNLQVTHAEDSVSKNGNPQAKWKLVVTKGPCEHLVLTHYTPLAGPGLKVTRGFLKAIGIEVPNSGLFDFDYAECIGRELSADIVINSYNGVESSRISRVYPLAA